MAEAAAGKIHCGISAVRKYVAAGTAAVFEKCRALETNVRGGTRCLAQSHERPSTASGHYQRPGCFSPREDQSDGAVAVTGKNRTSNDEHRTPNRVASAVVQSSLFHVRC